RLLLAGADPPRRRTRRAGHRRMARTDVAGDKRTASELKAWLCFEDEAGQGLRPPRGRTWGRRGATPVVKVTSAGTKRVSLAGLLAFRPHAAHAPRFTHRTLVYHGRKNQKKGCDERDYIRLLDAAHQQLGGS